MVVEPINIKDGFADQGHRSKVRVRYISNVTDFQIARAEQPVKHYTGYKRIPDQCE